MDRPEYVGGIVTHIKESGSGRVESGRIGPIILRDGVGSLK